METDCIFCKIIRGELPAEFLIQTDRLVAFKDINPHAPVHLLVVPRKHIRSVNDLIGEDSDILSDLVYAARDLARRVGVHQSGYKLLFNVEKGGGQVIFHLHLHLLGGWKR